MTKAFPVRTALLAALVLAVAALACSSDDTSEAPAAAAPETASAPTAAPEAAAEVVNVDSRGGATALGEFGEYLVTQSYNLNMTVTSTEFDHRRRIPRKYSCSDDDISVPITWSQAPEATVSIAVAVQSNQNPGAPWSHLVLWGIPSDAVGLSADIAKAHEAPSIGPAARQGTNDDGNIGWSGPCPPEVRHVWSGGGALEDPVKQYTFRVFALSTEISLGPERRRQHRLERPLPARGAPRVVRRRRAGGPRQTVHVQGIRTEYGDQLGAGGHQGRPAQCDRR